MANRKDVTNDNELYPIDEPQYEEPTTEIVPAQTPVWQLIYEPTPENEPILYGPEMQAFGFGFPTYKASDCVDRRVIVRAFKGFESAFVGQEYALFCRCEFADTGEKFNVVFGGKAIMEMLIANYLAKHDRPISFIPRRKLSGKGQEYWVAE